MNAIANLVTRRLGRTGFNVKPLLLSLLIIPIQMAATTDASAAVVVQGRAVGSFCCVMDANGKTLINGKGGTEFTLANDDTSTTAKVTWGVAKTGTANYFEFNGNGSNTGTSPGSTTTDNLFQIGTFDYYNATTTRDNIAQMSFVLNMSVLNGGTMMLFPTLQFDMEIVNSNDPQCGAACGDVARDAVNIKGVWMLNGGTKTAFISPMDFILNGAQYQFNLNGFAVLDASGNPMKDASGNVMFASSTLANEGTMTHAAIYGSITPVSAVPVPTAAWLLGSGLIGLAGIARRKVTTKTA